MRTRAPVLLLALALAAPAFAAPTLDGPITVTGPTTFDLGGQHVALAGIGAPTEACGAGPCADQATWQLTHATRGEVVHCQRQGQAVNGIVRAVCATDDGGDLASYLVGTGLVRNQHGYERQEALAKTRRAGLWRSTP